MRNIITLASIALFSASLAATPAMAKKDRNAVPAAKPAGEAESCIRTSQIQHTRVHGDKVIDFHMNGKKVYRNELPFACSGLGFEERFGYKTSTGQLCSSDIITVIHSPPSPHGVSCGLGKFQPVTLEKAPAETE